MSGKSLALQNHEKSQKLLQEQIIFLRQIVGELGGYSNEELVKDLEYAIRSLQTVKELENTTFFNFLRDE